MIAEYLNSPEFAISASLAAIVVVIRFPEQFAISTRRVGGLRFVKIGRLCLSWCVTREFRPFV